MRTIILSIFLILLSTSCLVAQATYPVMLSGLEQVPQVRTPAMGQMEVYFESDTLYVSGEFSDLRDTYWSAHIHFGEEGERGNRLFRLTAELNEDKRSGTFKKEENKFHLRELQREALRNGNLYINIGSERNQNGEIRGQIPPM